MFAKLQNAYAVLGDPHRRALYDCLGKDGIASDVTALIPRTKTPKEIREEYERLAKEREERMMQQRINPTSRLTMRVNATDLFERYMYDELYDDVIEPSLPTLEITEISFAQTIEAPLTLTDKFVIAGNVSTHNGKGSGSIGCTLKRVTSEKSSHEFDCSIGNGPHFGGKYYRRLSTNTFFNMSGSAQLYSHGLHPSLQISLTHNISKRLKGFLNYNVNYQLAENDDFYELNEQESGMSTEVHYNGEKYVFSTALQIGIPQTYITLNVTRKFTDPIGKIKASFRAGTFGLLVDYGIERKISAQSFIAATMTVGIPTGVLLKIRLNRGSQTYFFPLHLSDEILFQPLFYGTVTPLLGWFALKKIFLDPWEARKKEKEMEEKKHEKNNQMAEAKRDARHSVELMKERYQRIVTEETQRNGLVIIIALYGNLTVKESTDLLPEISDFIESVTSMVNITNPNELDSEEVSSISSLRDVINVTIPVQCLVEEQSKLILYEGSKNSLAGFYDPCSDEDKHLLVHYLYQGKHHQILVPDEDQVRCPRLSHQMPNQ